MSAPHSDDRHPRRPADGGGPSGAPDAAQPRNGHRSSRVLDRPGVPLPRAGGPAGAATADTVPAPRPPSTAAAAPPRGPAVPDAAAPTGPVRGPDTPPMPWPPVPPAPSAYPPGHPAPAAAAAGGNRRWRSLAAVGDRVGAATDRWPGPAVPHRVAAVAVGTTLVLATAVVAAAYATGGDTDRRAAGTRQSAPAAPVPADLADGTTAADPAAFGAVPQFRSPSGNIACRIDDGGARCDVADRSWSPPADPACAGGPGAGLVVGGPGAARPSCGGDPVGAGPDLDYGTRLTRGDVTCVSRRDGVECRDAGTGHGFEAARASFRLY